MSGPTFLRPARVLLVVATFWTGVSQAVATPEQTLMGLRDALVRNDLKALVHQAVPPADLAREIEQDSRRKARAPDPQWQNIKRQQFDDSFGRLIGPDAVNRIMADVQPQLEQMRAPMLAGQLLFFVEAAKALQTEEKLSDLQKAELQSLLNALQLYLARTDVLAPERFSKALQEVVMAARATGIVSSEQMEQLAFDDALVRFGVFLNAGKRALAHYDLDANAVLRSARFRSLAQTAEQAEVEVELTVLDVTVHVPMTLYAHEAGWFLAPPPVVSVSVTPTDEDLMAVTAEAAQVEAAAQEDARSAAATAQ